MPTSDTGSNRKTNAKGKIGRRSKKARITNFLRKSERRKLGEKLNTTPAGQQNNALVQTNTNKATEKESKSGSTTSHVGPVGASAAAGFASLSDGLRRNEAAADEVKMSTLFLDTELLDPNFMLIHPEANFDDVRRSKLDDVRDI